MSFFFNVLSAGLNKNNLQTNAQKIISRKHSQVFVVVLGVPERPPTSSGSASECRMAVMHPKAGKGGAWAAGCQQGPPW